MQDQKNLEDTPIEAEIRTICSELAIFLISKNRAYGNSVLTPANIFSKSTSLEQIDIRIDDKLNRIARGSEYPGDDTIKDLAGYLILRMAVKNIFEKDKPEKSAWEEITGRKAGERIP